MYKMPSSKPFLFDRLLGVSSFPVSSFVLSLCVLLAGFTTVSGQELPQNMEATAYTPQAEPSADSDNDGFRDTLELAEGTDPQDPDSKPGDHLAGLVLDLRFENNANDSSGFGHHAIDGGSASFTSGRNGFAAVINASHYFSIADGSDAPTALKFGNSRDFSVSFWVRAPNGWSADPSFISNKNWASGANTGWIIAGQTDSSQYQWNFKGASSSRRDFETGGAIADGNWHHVAVVHDRDGNATFYRDGVQVGQVSINGAGSVDTGLPIVIGRDGSLNNGFNQTIHMDEVRIWDRTLSSAEISLVKGPTPVDNGAFNNKRTLIIGIDGLRSDVLEQANLPNIQSLLPDSAYTFDAVAGGYLGEITQQPTISGPGWSSILTGVWANKHGVVDNSFAAQNYTTYPHFFSRIRETHPNAKLSSISVWSPINNIIVGASANSADFILNVSNDVALQTATIQHLQNSNPDVLFVHFDEMDHTGHSRGFSTEVPQYMAAAQVVDTQIGNILTALRNRPNFAQEDWQIILTTDHGGSGVSHGGQTNGERRIFLIVNASNVSKTKFNPGPGHASVPATVCKHLGVPVNPAWGWEAEAFGYTPHPTSNLTAQYQRRLGQVLLQWSPAQGLNLDSTQILRNGTLIATLPSSANTYQFIVPSPSGDFEDEFTIRSLGPDASSSPDLSSRVSYFKGSLSESLVAYYPFNQDFLDYSNSPNTNHASIGAGSPSFISGKVGNAVALNGINDYLSLGTPSDLQFGTDTDFSIAFWYRTSGNQTSDPVIIGNKNWSNGNNRGWLIKAAATTKVSLGLNAGNSSSRADTDSTVIATNSWTHVIATFRRGQRMELYVNGVKKSSTSLTKLTGSLSSLATNIGQDGSGTYSDATLMDIDELAIWRRALTPSEITSVWPSIQSGLPMSEVISQDHLAQLDPFSEWAKLFQLSENSFLDDPDQDGVLNLVEFTRGTSPVNNSTSSLNIPDPTVNLLDSPQLTATHPRPVLNNGRSVEISLQISDNLTQWSNHLPNSASPDSSLPADWEMLHWNLPKEPADLRFYRFHYQYQIAP